MTVRELMAGRTPSADFAGFVTSDDWVLAVDVSGRAGTAVEEYVVAQRGIAGLEAQFNPVLREKHYLRAGVSTTKTGTQRTFRVTGDRFVGDPFQDFAFSHAVKYGTGQGAAAPYVYFCIPTGQGEKGEVTLLCRSDGSGAAGENAGIDIELRKLGEMPAPFTYAPAGGQEGA